MDDDTVLYGFPGYSISWNWGSISAVSETGTCLLALTSRWPWAGNPDEWRWALVGEDGVLWLGGTRPVLSGSRFYRGWPHTCAISRSGTRFIYEDGFLLHVVTLEED